jgi:hypothetical protein
MTTKTKAAVTKGERSRQKIVETPQCFSTRKFRGLQPPPHDPQSWNIWLIHLKCVPTFGHAICWCERGTNTQ